MFGFMRPKPKSGDPIAASNSGSTQLDLDTEDNNKNNPARRTSSEPLLVPYLHDDDNNHGRRQQTSAASPTKPSARDKDRYMNDFRNSGGLQSQTMEDLEKYAVYKAEETTNSVNNCLRIAENIREDATRKLDTVNKQGVQTERTHMMAADIDKDLLKGEKLLNGLGGMFSMPWEPKKTREIIGSLITSDNSSKKSDNGKEQREKLGLALGPKTRPGCKMAPPEPTDAIQKAELKKSKQHDALLDLSDRLGDLKGMALDMGSEFERQNKALDHLNDDGDELNSRVKGTNQRARHLLAK